MAIPIPFEALIMLMAETWAVKGTAGVGWVAIVAHLAIAAFYANSAPCFRWQFRITPFLLIAKGVCPESWPWSFPNWM